MAGHKPQRTLDYLLLLLLGVFPLGQLPGILNQSLLGTGFRPHTLDIIVLFTTIFMALTTKKVVEFKAIGAAVVALLFSAALFAFTPNFDLAGLLYAVRAVAYLLFLDLLLRHFFSKRLMLRALVLVGVGVALFGWVQYVFYPDLTSLKFVGWDDHYFRLTSTFLDPAFTGILLAFAALASVGLYLRTKKQAFLLMLAAFMLSLGFTYSRASFLAFIIGLFFLLRQGNKTLFAVLVVGFALIVLLLPSSVGGEGVKLARTSSISQKIESYKASLQIISRSPLFGVGYNNICRAKESLNIAPESHRNSCYGLDNSFLYIWATTGILGLLAFGSLFIRLYSKMGSSLYGQLARASMAALAFHALFSNTIFYSWVVVWMTILARMGLKEKKSL